ncbi:MAG: SPOR domain-containing protein [Candidatus Zixiibacteriota bacterium]
MFSRYSTGLTLIFVIFLLNACANRQEEAARLEREIMSQDTAISLAVITRDSLKSTEVATAQAPSADAIPPSEELASGSETTQVFGGEADPMAVNSSMDSVLSLVASQTANADESQSANVVVPETSTAPATTADLMPRREVQGKFTVQIAASISEDYALGLVDVYTRRGYDPYIDMKIISDVTWYRVRIGHFETVAEAANTRDELINQYSLQAWVDNIPQ